MPWATVEQVEALTNTTVTEDELAMAQGIIELYSGATEAMTDISARDLRHLRMAVAYQAKWMRDNPELFGRVGVSSFSQDGLSFALGTSNSAGRQAETDQLVLSIMSKQALKFLSWRGSKSISLSLGTRLYDTWEEWRDAWLSNEVCTHHPVPGFSCGCAAGHGYGRRNFW